MSRSEASPPPLAACPGLPRDDQSAPLFAAPWQAQAFALVVALHARGAFSWEEWTQALARELAAHAHDDYYEHWLNALSQLLQKLGIVDSAALAARISALAAHTPPH